MSPRDQQQTFPDFDAPHEQADAPVINPSQAAVTGRPVPSGSFDLDRTILEAFKKAGRSAPNRDLVARAREIFEQAAQKELDPAVRVSDAVERAVSGQFHGFRMDVEAPDLFVGGLAYSRRKPWLPALPCVVDGSGWQGMPADDLATLPKIRQKDVQSVAKTSRLSAKWSPFHSAHSRSQRNRAATSKGKRPKRGDEHRGCRIWDDDPLRPPAEAMALAAYGITRNQQHSHSVSGQVPALDYELHVLGLNLGHSAAYQILSALLPKAQVFACKEPFGRTDPDQQDYWRHYSWGAVVVGLPSAHAWQLGGLLGNPHSFTKDQQRSILHRGPRDPFGHVPGLITRMRRFCSTGQMLVLVGDPEVHEHVVRHLVQEGIAKPRFSPGTDTRLGPIAVRYEQPQKLNPHLPAASSRVVSFWSWT